MFVRLRSLLARVYSALKLVICREDLPSNPRWAEQGYPDDNCWDVDELFSEATAAGPGSPLYHEARRIYWEAMWRLWGRYKRGRPFFRVYELVDHEARPVEGREEWVLENIVASAMAHGIVPPGARGYTYKPYRRLYGPPVAR